MTSPMQGHRARVQADKYFGATDVFTVLADYRKYFWMKPLGLAFRAYSYGIYGGKKGEGVLQPLYLGYPWLIRGYENVSYGQESTLGTGSLDISRLSGTRWPLQCRAELPFSGPEQLALIKSKYFLTDLNLFLDAGLAGTGETRLSSERRVPRRCQARNTRCSVQVFPSGSTSSVTWW
jgi:hypothetical protein